MVDCEGTSDLKHNQEAVVPVGERGNKLLEKKKREKNAPERMAASCFADIVGEK